MTRPLSCFAPRLLRLGRAAAAAAVIAAGGVLSGCATAPSQATAPVPLQAAAASRAATAPKLPRPVRVLAVTATHELIAFHANAPAQLLERRSLTGLAAGERLVGIDFRVARGVLFALAHSGRLYTLDTATGALQPVGTPPAGAAFMLQGEVFGMDFNPAADRIRVASSAGQNLRLHPDTGALVDGDPAAQGVQPDAPLRYAPADVNAGRPPRIAGVAYTYHPSDSQLTTNYAIDAGLGVLVMQGSREGATPVESPNAGQLRTVGPLGLGPLADVAFDIADLDNTALAAARTRADAATRLYRIDLASGAARMLGTVADGAPLLGMAIEP